MVQDPLETMAPPPGLYPISDGRRRGLLDLTRTRSRVLYDRRFQRRLETLEHLARRHQAHLITLSTTDAVGSALALALRARAAGRARGSAP